MGAVAKIIGKYVLGIAAAGFGVWEIVDGVKTIQRADSDLSDYKQAKRAAKEEQEQA